VRGRVGRGVTGNGSERLRAEAAALGDVVGLGKICAGTLFGNPFCAGSSPDSAGGVPEAAEAGCAGVDGGRRRGNMTCSLTEEEQIPICGRKAAWVPCVLIFCRMPLDLEVGFFPIGLENSDESGCMRSLRQFLRCLGSPHC